MSNFIQDSHFGEIVDFDGNIRTALRASYEILLSDFNIGKVWQFASEVFDDEPSEMTTASASILAWMLLLAADEYELAEELKDSIFTLAWTEEHAGSDLLSLKTTATPLSDDPNEQQFHVQGEKWLINNSYHADYHVVLAKIDPLQSGPRSLSLFLVPHSSTQNWERLDTHVLTNMVLTKYEINGNGRLIGKAGHGLSIVQRMAMPSKYQCAYLGTKMVGHSVRATIDHLSTKTIFKEQPINFNNVFRQLYNLATQAAYQSFLFYRALVFSDSSFLAFHGTMLKSFSLLRNNETMTQSLLVAGSKGFLKESVIGRNAFDSFVLPVFDGHYTINTLMTAKYMSQYLSATHKISAKERIQHLRNKLFITEPSNLLNHSSRKIRRPEFFDYADYWQQMDVPLDIDVEAMLQSVRSFVEEVNVREWDKDGEYKYKIGTLVHWLESVLAAAEMWKVFENDNYLNVIVQQYNGLVKAFNDIVSEGVMDTVFMISIRHIALPEIENNEAFLRDVMDIHGQLDVIKRC